MIVEFLKIYAPMHENDDGRALGPIAYFSSYATAGSMGLGKGAWGGNASVSEFSAIRLENGSVYVVTDGPIDLDQTQSKHDADLRDATLASLTDEQKRVLNVK